MLQNILAVISRALFSTVSWCVIIYQFAPSGALRHHLDHHLPRKLTLDCFLFSFDNIEAVWQNPRVTDNRRQKIGHAPLDCSQIQGYAVGGCYHLHNLQLQAAELRHWQRRWW